MIENKDRSCPTFPRDKSPPPHGREVIFITQELSEDKILKVPKMALFLRLWFWRFSLLIFDMFQHALNYFGDIDMRGVDMNSLSRHKQRFPLAFIIHVAPANISEHIFKLN